MKSYLTIAAVVLVLLLLTMATGAGIGYWYHLKYGPQPEKTTPAVAIEQPKTPDSPHGSLVLPRTANRKPHKPPHQLPKGSVEERRDSATVQPTDAQCPPVTVNLSTVRDSQGGRRVIVSSPNGRITQGSDLVIEPVLMPAEPQKWAAGVSYGNRDYGLWVDRDVGKLFGHGLVVGADVIEDRNGTQARVRLGVRF